MLSVVELISSIQGEGRYTGYPTTFVRLHNCNLLAVGGCSYCDTRYVMQKRKKKMSILTLIRHISKLRNKYVCITGGEPLLQDECLPLVYELLNNGYRINIETNGTIPIEESYKRSFSYTMDIKCPCSGMVKYNKYSNLDNLQTIDDVKFVINDREDYIFALNVLEKHPTYASIIFSPVFRDSQEETLDFAREVSRWLLEDKICNAKLGLQLHKILNIY